MMGCGLGADGQCEPGPPLRAGAGWGPRVEVLWLAALVWLSFMTSR